MAPSTLNKTFHFRPATLADWELLLRWRNDPNTRQQSLSQDEVRPDEHQRWLETSLKNAKRRLYIAYIQEVAIGTVRLDEIGDVWELSWTVAPEARGHGHGTEMVRQATSLVGSDVIAQIKDDNAASVKIAEHAGFKQVKSENGVSLWRFNSGASRTR